MQNEIAIATITLDGLDELNEKIILLGARLNEVATLIEEINASKLSLKLTDPKEAT